jgi:hypothetical protein
MHRFASLPSRVAPGSRVLRVAAQLRYRIRALSDDPAE